MEIPCYDSKSATIFIGVTSYFLFSVSVTFIIPFFFFFPSPSAQRGYLPSADHAYSYRQITVIYKKKKRIEKYVCCVPHFQDYKKVQDDSRLRKWFLFKMFILFSSVARSLSANLYLH